MTSHAAREVVFVIRIAWPFIWVMDLTDVENAAGDENRKPKTATLFLANLTTDVTVRKINTPLCANLSM